MTEQVQQAESQGEASIEAVVIRCGCTDPLSHALKQEPCPTPKAVQDMGVIWKGKAHR